MWMQVSWRFDSVSCFFLSIAPIKCASQILNLVNVWCSRVCTVSTASSCIRKGAKLHAEHIAVFERTELFSPHRHYSTKVRPKCWRGEWRSTYHCTFSEVSSQQQSETCKLFSSLLLAITLRSQPHRVTNLVFCWSPARMATWMMAYHKYCGYCWKATILLS